MMVAPGCLFKKLSNKPAGKVLVVKRTGGIGDLLMLSPSLKLIKENFPLISLSFSFPYKKCRSYKALADQWEFLDCIVDYDTLNISKFDYTVDVTTACIQYELKGKTSINRIDLYSHWLGISSLINKLPVCKPYKNVNIFSKKIESPLIGIHLYSIDKERNWSVKKYKELLTRLHNLKKGTFIIIDDEDSDFEKYSNRTITFKNLCFKELVNCINGLDLLICPDSGPMHIAGALERPCVALFGPTDPRGRIGYYKGHEAAKKKHNSGNMQDICSQDVFELIMSKINANML